MNKRKGFSRRVDIPADVLMALSKGEEEPLTLTEWLAVDEQLLLPQVWPSLTADHPHPPELAAFLLAARKAREEGVMARQKALGQYFYDNFGDPRTEPGQRVYQALLQAGTGVVREWAAFWWGAVSSLSWPERLDGVKVFAGDPYMNVREIAWLSFRPHLVAEGEEGLRRVIHLLLPWVGDTNPFIRRCAIESLRPRGVWCPHLEVLKAQPWLVEPLLELLRTETDRYVQSSVANWLNDASKSHPTWVLALMQRWQEEAPGKTTAWIAQRALRTLTKKGLPASGSEVI